MSSRHCFSDRLLYALAIYAADYGLAESATEAGDALTSLWDAAHHPNFPRLVNPYADPSKILTAADQSPTLWRSTDP